MREIGATRCGAPEGERQSDFGHHKAQDGRMGRELNGVPEAGTVKRFLQDAGGGSRELITI